MENLLFVSVFLYRTVRMLRTFIYKVKNTKIEESKQNKDKNLVDVTRNFDTIFLNVISQLFFTVMKISPIHRAQKLLK